MPSLVVIEQPNDSNISTADKLSRVLRARRDMEAGARHPDALVQREKDEINCARRRIHIELTTFKSIKSTAHAQKSALLWIIREHGWGGGGKGGLSMFVECGPLVSQNPRPIIISTVANFRTHLSHF